MVELSFSINSKGLERALTRLPKAMGKSVLRAAAKKSLKPVMVAAEANSPVGRTGRYKKSWAIKSTLSKRQRRGRAGLSRGGVIMYVGSTDPKAHLLEFGTIKMAARPVLRPAWDANKHRVLAVLSDEVWFALAKAARRLARRAASGKLGLKQTRSLSGGLLR